MAGMLTVLYSLSITTAATCSILCIWKLLQAMVDAKVNSRLDYQKYYDRELKRCQKSSIILERFISPEGTFPAFGRSIPYRMATMQPLALMAWYQKVPKDLEQRTGTCCPHQGTPLVVLRPGEELQ